MLVRCYCCKAMASKTRNYNFVEDYWGGVGVGMIRLLCSQGIKMAKRYVDQTG